MLAKINKEQKYYGEKCQQLEKISNEVKLLIRDEEVKKLFEEQVKYV